MEADCDFTTLGQQHYSDNPIRRNFPRRGDEIEVSGEPRAKLCRIRVRDGVREMVCTTGAKTVFVPVFGIRHGWAKHFRNGRLLNAAEALKHD